MIASVLKEFKTLFLSINDATDFSIAFEIACKTYSNIEVAVP